MRRRWENGIKLTMFLAMTMICSMWCGWISHARTNRGAYPSAWFDIFKKLIVDAFEIGQKYSRDQP
jgi:hypothetical protein